MKIARYLLIHLCLVGAICLGLAQLTTYSQLWLTYPILAPLLLIWPSGLGDFLLNAGVLVTILAVGLSAFYRTREIENLHAMLGLYWSWNLVLLFWLVMAE